MVSGKLADDLYYMVGGYVTDGPGVRNAGFDTEQGGQFTANITKRFAQGKFDVFVRYTDDHGEWYLPFATGVPGLNLGTYNPLNNHTRYATVQTASGGTQNIDIGDGRGWNGVVAGGSLDYDFGGGFEFRDRFGVTDGDLNTYGLVNDGGAVTVAQVLAANSGLGSVSTVHTNQTLAPSSYVQDYGAWMALKHLNYLSNDMSLSKTIDNNAITLGYYFARFSSDDNWSIGNDEALEIGGAGDLVNITATQLAAAYNGGNQNGAPYAIQDSGTDNVNAVYVADFLEGDRPPADRRRPARGDAEHQFRGDRVHQRRAQSQPLGPLLDGRGQLPARIGHGRVPAGFGRSSLPELRRRAQPDRQHRSQSGRGLDRHLL